MKTEYIAKIDREINETPCIIGVTYFHKQRGTFASKADSDLDYLGYTEMEWELLDEAGNPAPELEKALTKTQSENIEIDIEEYFWD